MRTHRTDRAIALPLVWICPYWLGALPGERFHRNHTRRLPPAAATCSREPIANHGRRWRVDEAHLLPTVRLPQGRGDSLAGNLLAREHGSLGVVFTGNAFPTSIQQPSRLAPVTAQSTTCQAGVAVTMRLSW